MPSKCVGFLQEIPRYGSHFYEKINDKEADFLNFPEFATILQV